MQLKKSDRLQCPGDDDGDEIFWWVHTRGYLRKRECGAGEIEARGERSWGGEREQDGGLGGWDGVGEMKWGVRWGGGVEEGKGMQGWWELQAARGAARLICQGAPSRLVGILQIMPRGSLGRLAWPQAWSVSSQPLACPLSLERSVSVHFYFVPQRTSELWGLSAIMQHIGKNICWSSKVWHWCHHFLGNLLTEDNLETLPWKTEWHKGSEVPWVGFWVLKKTLRKKTSSKKTLNKLNPLFWALK